MTDTATVAWNDYQTEPQADGPGPAWLRGSGITLSANLAATPQRRTNGWAAGLRLAAISLAGDPMQQPAYVPVERGVR